MKNKTRFICEECKKEYFLLPGQIANKKGKKIRFCSHKCINKSNSKKWVKSKCDWCNKTYNKLKSRLKRNGRTKEHTFCCKECSSLFFSKNPRIKNGYWYENGYKVLYLKGDRSIKEHIFIMQNYIGREINPKNENVHHINGIKDDNRIENLQLMTKGEHSSLHRKQEFAKGKKFGRALVKFNKLKKVVEI